VNLEQARSNMIQQQVRTWQVLDVRVLDALEATPREDFVPPRHRKLAFSDLRIPLAHDQIMMRPVEQGRLLQGLALNGSEKVLEVGSGSGFLTACLARLAAEVTSIEIFEDLAEQARANLEGHGVKGLDLRAGDVFAQQFSPGSFDAVVVSCSVARVPTLFTDLLAPGGRLFIVCGQSPAMEARVLSRDASGALTSEGLYETDLPRLIGAEDVPTFQF
jgi:protein-L-isoaspartate(D-aspartate) O-methyltransferase